MGEGKEDLKLLGAWFSPYPYRVKLALNFKKLQYENLEQDLSHKSSLLVESNPIHKAVPVLIHNGKPVCESLVIVEYLDDTMNEYPILPRDPYERAMARFWAKFVDEKFGETLRKVLLCDGEQQENAMKKLEEEMEILEGEIKGKKFFGGESIGLADIALSYFPNSLEPIEVASCVKILDPARYPNLAKWMENFLELPLVKEISVPPKEDLVMYFEKIRQYTLAKDSLK